MEIKNRIEFMERKFEYRDFTDKIMRGVLDCIREEHEEEIYLKKKKQGKEDLFLCNTSVLRDIILHTECTLEFEIEYTSSLSITFEANLPACFDEDGNIINECGVDELTPRCFYFESFFDGIFPYEGEYDDVVVDCSVHDYFYINVDMFEQTVLCMIEQDNKLKEVFIKNRKIIPHMQSEMKQIANSLKDFNKKYSKDLRLIGGVYYELRAVGGLYDFKDSEFETLPYRR